MHRNQTTFCTLLIAITSLANSQAADWPTYAGNNRRGNTTVEQLDTPLNETWVHRTTAPRPAWPAPAKQDFWHNKYAISPSVTFDWAHHVAIAEGSVYYGSSALDKLTCLEASTGRVRWTFFTEGPIRLAPSVDDGKVYFGSDDGQVYCIDAKDGSLLWKHRPTEDLRRVPGNGRMISLWPIRTGVLVDDGTAYFCAGLFPSHGIFLEALDASTGTSRWQQKLGNLSPQGYLLASDRRLYVPTGRTSPAAFDRNDGRPVSGVKSGSRGGSFALVCNEGLVFRGNSETGLEMHDANSGDRLVLFDGRHVIVHEGKALLHSAHELAALDRATFVALVRKRSQLRKVKQTPEIKQQQTEVTQAMEDCWIWRQPCEQPFSMILAGKTIWLGGDNEVAGYRLDDGKTLESIRVDGKAHGLAVADGRLFVSTDKGNLHCFQ